MFSFEIYGRTGKLDISGLGGSYGVERLTCYRMLPGMGPPETTAWEYPMADDSWQAEMADFYAELPINIRITGNYHDMGAFASDVAQLPRIVTLNDVVVNNDKGILTMDAVAKTFRYLDEEEIAKQRKAAKDAKDKKDKGKK